MQPDRLQRSGRNSPCPACGRIKDADCAFNHDTILCHQGSDPRPTDNLRPGDTIAINGRLWALIRHNAGYSGCADLLKPHSERSPAPLTKPERLAHDVVQQQVVKRLSKQKVFFFELVAGVRGHIDPYWLTLAELDIQQAVQDRAWSLGIAYAKEANAIGRQRPGHRAEMQVIARLLKEVNYQRKDTRAFRKHFLGELNG